VRTESRLSGSGMFYLTSVGLVAAATVAIFFGAGFFLLASPGGGMISGSIARSGLETGILADGRPDPARSDGRPAATKPATSPETSDTAQNAGASHSIAAAGVDNAAKEGPLSQLPAELPKANYGLALAPTPTASPSPPEAAPRVPSGPSLTTAEITALLEHGDSLLRTGDVVSARLFYERAAAAGDGGAALRAGATFDPAFLNRAGLGKVQADAAEARSWYNRAVDLGAADAKRQLDNLTTRQGR
jgi:TPR repeat protein